MNELKGRQFELFQPAIPSDPAAPRSAQTSDAAVEGSPQCALSVVVPVYNEEAVLPAFHRRLHAVLAQIADDCEIIYIDDGSSDRTPHLLRELQWLDAGVGIARLSRHFGKQQALFAGIQLARGAAVVLMDADLQDPPESIPAMIAAWRDGADVVNMRRTNRAAEIWAKRLTAQLFYRIMNRRSEVPIPAQVGDFRLLSRHAVEALKSLTERNRFMQGLFAWIGFRQTTLDFERAPRAAGRGKWDHLRLWQSALRGIPACSIMLLRIARYLGLVSSACALIYSLYFVLKTWFFGDPMQGFPTLIVSILFLGGLLLLAIGILGEYIGRLYIKSKRRPLYPLGDYRPALLGVSRHKPP